MPLPAGADAPGFALPDAGGVARTLADLAPEGAALLVFFKTSCPTCRLGFPVYGELARRYGDALPVVAVTQTQMAVTRPWLADAGFLGPVLDDEQGHYAVSRAYDIRSVPTLVLVEHGRVVASSEAWDRERANEWARDLGRRTGRDTAPVSNEGDGRPAFRPG
ncbi:MAG: TlpA family protein disulfide reductase [Acidimicrobiales bacterium]